MIPLDHLHTIERELESVLARSPTMVPVRVRAALESVRAEIWQRERPLSTRQLEIIAEAEVDGRVKVSSPYRKEAPSRLKPEIVRAGDGETLLALLGLNNEVYK